MKVAILTEICPGQRKTLYLFLGKVEWHLAWQWLRIFGEARASANRSKQSKPNVTKANETKRPKAYCQREKPWVQVIVPNEFGKFPALMVIPVSILTGTLPKENFFILFLILSIQWLVRGNGEWVGRNGANWHWLVFTLLFKSKLQLLAFWKSWNFRLLLNLLQLILEKSKHHCHALLGVCLRKVETLDEPAFNAKQRLELYFLWGLLVRRYSWPTKQLRVSSFGL